MSEKKQWISRRTIISYVAACILGGVLLLIYLSGRITDAERSRIKLRDIVPTINAVKFLVERHILKTGTLPHSNTELGIGKPESFQSESDLLEYVRLRENGTIEAKIRKSFVKIRGKVILLIPKVEGEVIFWECGGELQVDWLPYDLCQARL